MLLRLLTFGALATTAACFTSERDPVLIVTDIEVTGENDLSLLDVEVHLFDESTRAHLGCSGQRQGMEPVDDNDIRYALDAVFVRPDESEIIDRDLIGRPIEMIVIEDDEFPCPEPPGPEDDVIGLAAGLDIATFDVGQLLTFDRVTAIRVTFD
jgi:hypothetical protein